MLTCYGGAIYCRSKQQAFAAQSSKQSEFVVSLLCVRDLLWLQKFKRDFEQFKNAGSAADLFIIVIGEDSQACLAEVLNDGLSELSRPIDL